MRPNFYDQLNLRDNGRTVAAGGPCDWAVDDTWTEIRDVTIAQGNVVGSSHGSAMVRASTDDEWWLDVSSSDLFVPGGAQARALAVVHKLDGTVYQADWSDTVYLNVAVRRARRLDFFGQLDLRDNGRTVAAGGPCGLEPGDEWAEIRDVTIAQGKVVGSSHGSVMVRAGRDDEWWLDVSSSDLFVHGEAEASALAVVHKLDGATYEFPWSRRVYVG
jgi:hypothetical protein